jgi:hypothetical protein
MVPNELPRDEFRVVLEAELLDKLGPLFSFLHDARAVKKMIHLHWEMQGRRSGGGRVAIGDRT